MTNRSIVDTFIALVKNDDRAAANELLHEHFFVVESEGLPYAGTWRGKDGFWRLIETVFGLWGSPALKTVLTVGADDAPVFAIEMEMDGTSATSGKKFRTSVCELWSVKDGKISSIKPYYWDTKLMTSLV